MRYVRAVCGAAIVLLGAALVTPSSNSRFVTLWRGSLLEAAGLPGWAASPIPQDSSPARQIPVTPPPMGWSSWNSFSNLIDAKIVMQQTQALIDSGMAKSGYRYINIDEGWWLGERDAHGDIVVEPQQWPALAPGERPGDMSNIVRFIHRHGLKAGIYTDAGDAGCGFYGPDLGPPMPHTGSVNYYDQDFLQFAQWGFDYVKVDWCGGNKHNLDPALQYAAIAHAMERAEKITGHGCTIPSATGATTARGRGPRGSAALPPTFGAPAATSFRRSSPTPPAAIGWRALPVSSPTSTRAFTPRRSIPVSTMIRT